MYQFKSLNWIVGNQGSLLDENRNLIYSNDVANKKEITMTGPASVPGPDILRDSGGCLVNGWDPYFL